MNQSDHQWLTEPQAARVLGIHHDTLRRWRKKGAVGFVLTPGGRVRYLIDDVVRLQTAMRVPATLGAVLP